MSNLGLYKEMTTLAKKVGGPLALAALTAVGGYTVGRAGEFGLVAGVQKLVRTSHTRGAKRARRIAKLPVFTVHTEAETDAGVTLHQSQRFRVLERDGDMAQIAIVGDKGSPYPVSAALLARVSDFFVTDS